MEVNWIEWEVISIFCEQEKIVLPNKNDVSVVERNTNPVGFMTDLNVDLDVHGLMHNKNVYELIPTATSQPSLSSLGFLLFFTEGVLSAIEGYVYGEKWPENDVSLQFSDLPVSI